MKATTGLLLISLFLSGCATTPSNVAEKDFSFDRDTFAFKNETLWTYRDGKVVSKDSEREKYVHRCFVMTRSALQFWKFAEFDRSQRPLPEKELGNRIRAISRISVWRNDVSDEEKIFIPGYSGLKDLSAREPELLKANIGDSWPTFFRMGNLSLAANQTENDHRRTFQLVTEWLDKGHPIALWLWGKSEGTPINHVVLAYDRKGMGTETVLSVYDPNIPDAPQKMRFDSVKGRFSYEKTFYFPGGEIDVRPIYLSSFK